MAGTTQISFAWIIPEVVPVLQAASAYNHSVHNGEIHSNNNNNNSIYYFLKYDSDEFMNIESSCCWLLMELRRIF